MGNNITALRTQERAALRDGKIDASEAKQLAETAAKTNTPEDWAALRDMFAHDRLDTSVNVDKVLGKTNAVKADTRQSPIRNAALGKGEDVYGHKVDATLTRTIGNVDGYKTRYEALAAARLGGAVNGVVIEKSGRFYAGEASAALTSPHKGVTPVAPLDMAAYKKVQADTSLSIDDKNKKLAAMAFGLPESDIKVVHAASEREAGKINIDSSLPADKNGQTTKDKAAAGPIDGTPPAIALSPELLKDPMRAATTLFHEGTHAADMQTANEVVKKFPKGFDPKRDAKKANELIEKWPGLTRSARTAVREYLKLTPGGDETTEARGYAKALAGALDNDPAGVRDQLVGLAAEIQGLAGNDVAGSATFKELAADLKKKLATLPADKRKIFDDAAAQLAKGHPAFVKALDDAGLTSRRVSAG